MRARDKTRDDLIRNSATTGATAELGLNIFGSHPVYY